MMHLVTEDGAVPLVNPCNTVWAQYGGIDGDGDDGA